MTELNVVAIVGRPNVGKSCLFNRLVGKRQAIVEATSGVTRDRIYGQSTWRGRSWQMADTGGLEFRSAHSLQESILSQAAAAAREACCILFVVDGCQGLMPLDHDVMEFLRPLRKPMILVVNKIDDPSQMNASTAEFYRLGVAAVVGVSALHGHRIDALGEMIAALVPDEVAKAGRESPGLRLSIIGKPNAGKSSLVNAILKQDRVIVHDQPGTTRDAVDTVFEFKGQRLVLIDTAGISRKKKIREPLDQYSRMRTMQAIERADVAVVVLDAQQGVTQDDKHIFELLAENEICCVIAVNKHDLVPELTVELCRETIHQEAAFMRFALVCLCSAKQPGRVDQILRLAQTAFANSQRRIPQEELNDVLNNRLKTLHGIQARGKLRMHYLAQVHARVPTFVLIVNNPVHVSPAAMKSVENTLRQRYNFEGAPVKIIIKRKERLEDAGHA